MWRASTSEHRFEPFGERLASDPDYTGDQPMRAGRLALRLGIGLFWTLVAGIVTARIAFFDPTTLEAFRTVARLACRLCRVG